MLELDSRPALPNYVIGQVNWGWAIEACFRLDWLAFEDETS